MLTNVIDRPGWGRTNKFLYARETFAMAVYRHRYLKLPEIDAGAIAILARQGDGMLPWGQINQALGLKTIVAVPYPGLQEVLTKVIRHGTTDALAIPVDPNLAWVATLIGTRP